MDLCSGEILKVVVLSISGNFVRFSIDRYALYYSKCFDKETLGNYFFDEDTGF